jgi:pyruvate/2-oxoglutarate/acetoin dehydrogenase E1 component
MSMREAILEGLREEMRRDPDILLIGQDIGLFGGPLKATEGLWEEFGPDRLIQTPICESSMMCAAVGAALQGSRPVVDIMFTDLLPVATVGLLQLAANLRYYTAGEGRAPLVVRTRGGDGPYRAHPQNYEALFGHSPGLTVVMPSTPADAKGLLKASLRHDDPVIFVENIFLYNAPREPVPEEAYVVPLGTARIARPGRDLTVVTYGRAVRTTLRAAAELAPGIEIEVIDLRTVVPFDERTVLDSVRRTGRLITVHEAWTRGGLGAEIVARAVESGALRTAPIRIGAPNVPIPWAEPLRDSMIPSVAGIVEAACRVMQ